MDLTAKELAAILNSYLKDKVFQNLIKFLDEGNISELYAEMAEIDAVSNPDKYVWLPIEVEYDILFTGGDYTGVGTKVIVMSPADTLIPKHFKEKTGIDPVHIISFKLSDDAANWAFKKK